MRRTSLAIVLLAVASVGASCGKNPPAPLPPPPPVAPATPPPAPPPTSAPEVVVENEYDRLNKLDSAALDQMGLLQDVFFDFDSAELRDQDRETLNRNAERLKQLDFLKITVEGHADERGTVEYNLALTERRARAAHDYLLTLGVPADRMKIVAYGKEFPTCRESTEECWARNRRGHFAVTGKTTVNR